MDDVREGEGEPEPSDRARADTILVVEDDDDIRETLREVLEREGYDAVAAANGREALDRLETIDRPCLILLDLMMPVMSGGEFLTVMRRDDRLKADPVVILSAWPREAARVAHLTQGFVKKPVDLDVLLSVIETYCRPARAHPDTAASR